MRPRMMTIGIVLAATAVAGCGGTTHASSTPGTTHASSTAGTTHASSSTAGTTASHSPQPASGAPPTAFAARLLRAKEAPGLAPLGQAVYASSPQSWVLADQTPAAGQAEEAALLKRSGFLAGAREILEPEGALSAAASAAAISTAEQFSSASGARAYLAAIVGHAKTSSKPGEFVEFALPRIPGSRGFALRNSATTAVYIAFAEGAYELLVGGSWPTGTTSAPHRAEVYGTGADRLYERLQKLPRGS